MGALVGLVSWVLTFLTVCHQVVMLERSLLGWVKNDLAPIWFFTSRKVDKEKGCEPYRSNRA